MVEGQDFLRAFHFTTAISNFVTATDHVETFADLRAIANKWSQYNISVYHLWAPFGGI